MTVKQRVRTAGIQHKCAENGYPECNGIQRWRMNPYEYEVHGVEEYAWRCDGIMQLLEEDV